jgi:hypothetical protein
MSTDLQTTIAEYLSLHAEAVEKSGLEEPELHPRVPDELRQKMRQALANVNVTITGCSVEQHVLHIRTANRGLRLVLKHLGAKRC